MQLLNEQFSFLYSDYDKTQLKNNRIHLMRQKEIREKIPAYRQLEDQMRETSVLAARAALEGSHGSMGNLPKRQSRSPGRKRNCLRSTAIRKIIWSRSTPAPTATIPATSATENATVFKNGLSNTFMNNPI